MKIGLNIKIDVTKIDKSRIFEGKKGKYLDLVTFIDTEVQGEYGDNGFISQSTSKEEREAKVQTPILGNVTVFFTEDGQADTEDGQADNSQFPPDEGFDDDIPF